MELRNAVSKETLRKYLLTSSAEAIPQARPSLLSCFTNAENPKPQLQDRLSAAGEALESCSETALQSWFDPLEILLDQEAGTLAVRFPHAFFGIRFSSLFQKLFEKKARELWGKGLSITYGAGKFTPSPPVPFVQPAPRKPAGTPSIPPWPTDAFWGRMDLRHVHRQREAQMGLEPCPRHHPARRLPSHAWPCAFARRHRRSTGPAGARGPHGTGKTHLLRAIGNELFRTLGSDLYYASLSDLELLFAGRSVLAARQELLSKEAVLIDDFQHLSRIPDKTPTTASRFRAQLGRRAGAARRPSVREELCLLLDRFMDQGKPVIVAGVGRPKEWSLGKALLSRLETGLWAELPEPDLDVRLRYAQQQAKFRRLPLSREQLLLIAQHCPDVRRLSGVILRVASHRSLLGRDLSEQDLLNIVRQGGDSSALTPQLIVSIVGEHCGVPAKEILGEKRRPDLVQARQLAMYLCRELLGHSYPVIGRMFGGKDHSTVMHGVKKIKLLQESDRLAHSMVTELTKACLEHSG